MAHGTPDYGPSQAKTTVYGLTDIGELAARLGSIVTYDRRGDVIFLEDFEGGIQKWDVTETGAGAEVVHTAKKSQSGAFSCLLTGGSDSTRRAAIYKLMALPPAGAVGVEFSFIIDTDTDYVKLQMAFYTSSKWIYSEVMLYVADSSFSYYRQPSDWVALGDFPSLLKDPRLFHHLKMVVDYDAIEYKRVIFDDISYDISGNAPQNSASATAKHLYIAITNRSRSGENDDVYVEDVIVTQNEP